MSVDQMIAGLRRETQDSLTQVDRPDNSSQRRQRTSAPEREKFSDVVRDVQGRDNKQNDSSSSVRDTGSTERTQSTRNKNRDDDTSISTDTDSTHNDTAAEPSAGDNSNSATANPLAINPELATLSTAATSTGATTTSSILAAAALMRNPENVISNGGQSSENSEITQLAPPALPTAQATHNTSGDTSSANSSTQSTLLNAEASLTDDNSQASQQQQQSSSNAQAFTNNITTIVNTTNNADENVEEEPQAPTAANSKHAPQNTLSTNNSGGILINGFSQQLEDTTAPVQNSAKAGANAQNSTMTESNAMDKAVAKQVDRALVQNIGNNQRILQLRLTPPELGTIRIEIIESNGKLSVRLQAEDDSVRASLERSLPQLRQEIRGSDTPISSIDLTDSSFLMDQHRQAQQQQQQQQQRNKDQGQTFHIDGMDIPEAVSENNMSDIGITVDSTGVHGMI